MTTLDSFPHLPIVQRDPVDIAPAFRALQDQQPITRVRTATGDLAWMITRYEDVKALMADGRLGHSHPDPANAPRVSESVLLGGPMGDYAAEQELTKRKRGLLAPAFSPRRMRAIRERVEVLVGGLLDDLVEQAPPRDLHRHLSLPLPAMVICELLGVPYDDHEQFEVWSQRAAGMTDLQAAATAFGELVGYLNRVTERKRGEPGDDLISDLIAAEAEWELTSYDIAILVAILLFAGHESTVARIDIGTVLFLTNPDQRDLLRRDLALLPTAVEEVVRMSAPGDNGMPRYARTDVEVGGVTIGAGDAVLLAVTVANRDGRVFPEPDRFDITRTPNPHLGFGYGARFCIGATMARIELQSVFAALFRRVPTLRLAVPVEELRLRNDVFTGGMAELPVTW
jgi:cytochrome P450